MFLDKVSQDLQKSQLDKDELKTSTLRLLLSELKNETIKLRHELSDHESINVVQREIKKRREGASGFRQAQREELAQKEEAEERILAGYLPEQLSDEELTKIVEQSITDLGANSISQMGQVMAKVKEQVGQSADGGRISQIVREKLNG